MTSLIAFDIYRTETISVSGKLLVARFLRRKDEEAYELFLTDESTGEVWKCGYSAEIARDFAQQTGECIVQQIYSILKSDVDSGVRHA